MSKHNQYRIKAKAETVEWRLPVLVISLKIMAYTTFIAIDWMSKFN
jgi:hypothetical protein